MKSIFLSLILLVLTATVSAQEFRGLSDLPMKAAEDYKMAEPTVRECIKYLLSHAPDESDVSAYNAEMFITKWMNGTPTYWFYIDVDAVKHSQKSARLQGSCIASMIKAALDNPNLAKDAKALKLIAYKTFAEYCADPKYKVKQTGATKKLITANEKGQLESYLDWSFLANVKK